MILKNCVIVIDYSKGEAASSPLLLAKDRLAGARPGQSGASHAGQSRAIGKGAALFPSMLVV